MSVSVFTESFFVPESPSFPPFRSVTSHLHYSLYLCLSRRSLINLLPCHIPYLVLNPSVVSIACRKKFMFSSKSCSGFYYLSFAYELNFPHSWSSAKWATFCFHYLISRLDAQAHVGTHVWKSCCC